MSFSLGDAELALRAAYLTVVVVIWGVLVITLGNRGGSVDRPNRIPQLYGYTVCLITLVTMLLTLPTIVDNLFRLADPLQEESFFGSGPALSSFEAYQATYERAREIRSPGDAARQAPPPSEAELRKQYQALREERLSRNRFQARRALMRNGILLVLALGLFTAHWRWLRRRGGPVGG